jgi:hypothetical protein
MTREEYEKDLGYELDQHGLIKSPGKFEGELVFSPYFYEQSLDGSAEELAYMTDGVGEYVCLVSVNQDDRKLFPELSDDTAFVAVCESAQGFVNCQELTEERANEWRETYADEDQD